MNLDRTQKLIILFVATWVVMSARSALAGEAFKVEISEGWPEKWTWATPIPPPVDSFEIPSLALSHLPARYNARGVELDRNGPIVLRISGTLQAPEGPYTLTFRARSAARLVVDGKTLAETKPIARNSSGHEAVPPENTPAFEGAHVLPSSDQEKRITWTSDGQKHAVELIAVVGGKGLRNETGEILVAAAHKDEVPHLLGSTVPFTESGWARHRNDELRRLEARDTATRRKAAEKDAPYWRTRHEIARRMALEKAPRGKADEGNAVDRHAREEAEPSLDDVAFFRRLSLDTTGVIPAAEEVEAFLSDRSPNKRSTAIANRLADPRWADAWMGYWQDVLAENPGLLKPTLNNTGPFRRFLLNALADNLPLDRSVTELVRMEGSKLGGGPAGFGMATQNDAPMAAKAQVLAKAFLAADLKCARCHDAPFHPYAQEDLFGLAALLANKPQTIPDTSTVKRQPGGRTPMVTITINAGDSVAPEWNLPNVAPTVLPDGVLPAKATPRDRFAALMTSPGNGRFAQVMANRVWHRYMGRGLVEPVDDWDGDVKTHDAALLDDLARELMTHDYDLKHLARIIFESKAYQSKASEANSQAVLAPARRRMSAEQILDSMFAAVGKPFRAEELCLDIDGRRPPTEFLNLGRPERAWQLALPSNERDRPALTLPVVSSLTDLLLTFGWRAARPDALTVREEVTTPLQPALMANTVVIDGRIARLSDDSAITDLCLKDQSAEALIRAVTLRILSRPATAAETERLAAYLGDSYRGRIVPGAKLKPPMRPSARRVSWSNHLHPQATTIQQAEERIVREGDPATDRLTPAFRERMEEIVWALVNSPEFVFIP